MTLSSLALKSISYTHFTIYFHRQLLEVELLLIHSFFDVLLCFGDAFFSSSMIRGPRFTGLTYC